VGCRASFQGFAEQSVDGQLIRRANADRIDRLGVTIIEDRGREWPHHPRARVDVAIIVVDIWRCLTRVRADRRRMSADDVFGKWPGVTKEAIADPEFCFFRLLFEGHAWTNPCVNIVAEWIFVAGRQRAHPLLRTSERGRRTQGSNGCVAAVEQEDSEVPLGLRGAKHEVLVIASKADGPGGLEALDDLEDLARVWAAVDVVAEKDELVRLTFGVRLEPRVDLANQILELCSHAVNVADDDAQHRVTEASLPQGGRHRRRAF